MWFVAKACLPAHRWRFLLGQKCDIAKAPRRIRLALLCSYFLNVHSFSGGGGGGCRGMCACARSIALGVCGGATRPLPASHLESTALANSKAGLEPAEEPTEERRGTALQKLAPNQSHPDELAAFPLLIQDGNPRRPPPIAQPRSGPACPELGSVRGWTSLVPGRRPGARPACLPPAIAQAEGVPVEGRQALLPPHQRLSRRRGRDPAAARLAQGWPGPLCARRSPAPPALLPGDPQRQGAELLA